MCSPTTVELEVSCDTTHQCRTTPQVSYDSGVVRHQQVSPCDLRMTPPSVARHYCRATVNSVVRPG